VRMRSRGNDHDVGRRVEHVGVAGVIGSFFTVAEVAKIIRLGWSTARCG
jgi:hypothetical protein